MEGTCSLYPRLCDIISSPHVESQTQRKGKLGVHGDQALMIRAMAPPVATTQYVPKPGWERETDRDPLLREHLDEWGHETNALMTAL